MRTRFEAGGKSKSRKFIKPEAIIALVLCIHNQFSKFWHLPIPVSVFCNVRPPTKKDLQY